MGYNAPKQTVSQFQLKGRYARQYLSFAGKSSKDFLLYLSGPSVYDSPAADVESTSVPGRNGDIIMFPFLSIYFIRIFLHKKVRYSPISSR